MVFQKLKLNSAVFCILRGGVNTLYRIFGLNNILFKVLLTYYDIYIHTIFLGFDGKR